MSTTGILRIPSDQRVTSKKHQLLVKLGLHAGHPKSYSTNTTKEETVLEYVEDFRRQFVQVFPQRRPLVLCPKNECGVRKFVCTTVRPTLLPYNEIYNLEDAAEFVSDFFEYIPLDESTKLPDLLPSPSTTIKMRAGDCLDLANILCSVLRGNGYDAYVVSGYAPKWITILDQTKTGCPILEKTALKPKQDKPEKELPRGVLKPPKPVAAAHAPQEEGEQPQDSESNPNPEGGENAEAADGQTVDAAPAAPDSPKQKYPIKIQPDVTTSKYLKLREKEDKEEEEKKRKEADAKNQFVIDVKEDPLLGDRVHCWVLVKAGRRDVENHVYIEPSTGLSYSLLDAPYLGIESVWNESNYWANVQDASPREMQFDLHDSNNWEYVLIDEKKIELEDGGLNFEVVEDAEADKQLSPEEAFDDRDILDCPMSWCQKIAIDRQTFRKRYPGGEKFIHFQRCTVEKYSQYYENGNGIVLRITLFQTDECLTPIEIREFFMHRKDKLIKRYNYPLESRVHECFEPGRTLGLEELIQVADKKRYFTFYPQARVDGMVRRDELIGQKIIEEFENRDDFLVYRSVTVNPHFVSEEKRQNFQVELATCRIAPIRKMTEKFNRNAKIPAAKDVRKRTHFITNETIKMDYHYDDQCITAHSLLLDKKDKAPGNDALGGDDRDGRAGLRQNKLSEREQVLEKVLLQKLVTKEKDLFSEVKDREKDITTLLKKLREEMDDVKLEKSIYDLAHEQSKDEEKEKSDDADEDKDRNRVDYLSPFLAQHTNGKVLTRREAMQAKDDCLATLKERLLERANIIQRHLDDQKAKLDQRRIVFKRSPNTGAEQDDDFTKFYEDMAFKIDILKARLQRHEELALRKYLDMDQKLNNDPRLVVLKNPDNS